MANVASVEQGTTDQETARRVRRRRRWVVALFVVGFLLMGLATWSSFYLEQPNTSTVVAFAPAYLISLMTLVSSALNQRVLARPVLGWVVIGLSVVVLLACLFVTSIPLLSPPPWTSPRWPGVREAAQTPDACTVVPEATLARLVPGERTPASGITTSLGDGEEQTECVWETVEDAPGPQGRVSLQIVRRERGYSMGSTQQAREQVAIWRGFIEENEGAPTLIPQEGLGDEGWVFYQADAVSPPRFAETTVIARRVNVAIWVHYSNRPPEGERPDAAQIRDGAVEVARAAAERVTLP